ncbi:DENN domain-containing protein 3 isoform X3 [Gopherus flavomarginatus]|uniref:DENN domain-containing protein 3 isoform X3 n=1 Tax=Gopherus flavomarginatus TaxID=286002 RepID=UPI0021CBE434|nr:DENN domain-containing protein 3 isoform X3 [Gopherus flavomarginatus]
MAEVLPAGLLEICVLVGVSGERARGASQIDQKKERNSPPLDPEVLSVFVPPFISKEAIQATNINSSNFNKTKRRSFRKKRERPKVENVKNPNGEQKAPDTEDISVPKDIDLIGLPQLCFPGGLYITSELKEDHIHFLVFTDVCGNRTYGVVAQYYQPVQDGYISSNGQAHRESVQTAKAFGCFIPFAICVISRYPYFNALKDCLSCLLVHLRPLKDLDVDDRIKEFAAKLSLIPSPPPGTLHLIFNMKPLQIVFPSREDPDSPIIDLDLHLPLLCFKPEQVLQEAEDLILISIDNGDITHSKSSVDEVIIPDVPSQAAEIFIKRVESLQLHYDLELCHLSSNTDFIELQMRRRTWQQKLNTEVQQITLQLIVNIFREVKDHLNYEHRVFNSEEFLKTRSPGDQPFYKKVLETHIFHSFLKARLNRKMDAFARLELSTQSEEDRLNSMLDSPRRLTVEKMASKRFNPQYMISKRLVISMPNLQDIKPHDSPARTSSLRRSETERAVKLSSKSISTFKIPEIHFPLMNQCVHTYYTDFINHLTRAINILQHDNSALLARYFYLRGLIGLMQGKLLDALSDFQNLYKTDIRIFPTDLVRKVVETMPPSERSLAERKPELKRLISQVMEKQREVTKVDDHVKNFKLPKTHMQLDDFVKRIQESGIVKDIDTIHRLFDALTVGHQKQIDPETFKDFYNYWKETEAEAQEVNLPHTVLEHLDTNECVYKLSCSVKTNYGVGKIAMTQKRLFLLTEGRPGYVEITTFRNIEDVKSTTVAFLLLRIPTLRIKSVSKKEVFEANLKTECDLWHLMVKEMWAGKKMADDHKDPQYIQQALTNVLLMDAVVGALHSSKTIYAASKLSYFDKMKNEVPMMVPKTTSETLKHKINPSVGETFPQAVDVLLYTPGHLDAGDRIEDARPKLWCALSEGRVIVFDASTWTIQQHCFKVGSSKLTCMVMVEQSQVWIGSQDAIIYIINTHSMSCNKQLNDHRAHITDIIVENRYSVSSEAYSCSLDGTVIAWNINTLKVNRRLQLPCKDLFSVKLHDNRLWCCTGSGILVVTTNGSPRQEMKIEENPKDVCLHFLCFQLFPEGDQVWTSCSGSSDLYIWNATDLSRTPQKIHLQDCSEITCMIRVKSQIWIGSRGISQGKTRGKIYVIDAEKKTVEKELVGHADTVKALCSAEDRYVLSGSGREEGKIAIWKVE